MVCNVTTDLDLNHGGWALQNALSHRTDLEAFGRTLVAISKGRDGWYFDESSTSRITSLARWLAAHEGHQLRVIDEYGRLWDACSKDVICACGARSYCSLKPGHTGACAR